MKTRNRKPGRTFPILPGVFWLVSAVAAFGCYGPLRLTPSDHATVLQNHTLNAPHPGNPGPHSIGFLYYGSGTDRHRPEFRDSVSIVTESVDASSLVDLGSSARERNDYWGFSPDSFPINGRVWYPDGDGPFPLVLIVHGNHDMRDFSDPGYQYLGELLASRGYVFASVDMNFINGGIRNENDGRGWLLLKHLDAFATFAEDPSTPFHGRIDLERIVLIGHSRGGEAVGHAAAFNVLARYPDDASVEFDFGYGIKGIIAIAPVDGQYLPTGRLVPVRDVSYLVFHGSHDGDVTSFHGLRLFNRIDFSEPGRHFKAAVYMYRANHGQWNTVWGPNDNGPRSSRRLDLRGLIDPEGQREFAAIYVSAFLETVLGNSDDYLPLFRDHRTIGDWLPETMYITQFASSTFRALATFEEDIDVTTGTVAGAKIHGDSLGIWREELLDLRSRNRPTTSSSQGSNAVWLGWNNRSGGYASYRITIPEEIAAQLEPGSESGWSVDPMLGGVEGEPGPRKGADEGGQSGEGPQSEERGRDRGDEQETEQLDLSVVLTDADGNTANLPLSRYGPIRRPLETVVRRRNDADGFDQQWELVLQSFSIPIRDFVAANPILDPSALVSVGLLFDRAEAGTVVVDNIGFSLAEVSSSRD